MIKMGFLITLKYGFQEIWKHRNDLLSALIVLLSLVTVIVGPGIIIFVLLWHNLLVPPIIILAEFLFYLIWLTGAIYKDERKDDR